MRERTRFGRRGSVFGAGAALAVAIVVIAATGRAPAPAEAAAVSAFELLRATMIAAIKTTYQGTRVEMSWSDDQAVGSAATVFHAADHKSRVEYQASADASRRIVIDDGDRLWDVDLGLKRVIIGRSAASGCHPGVEGAGAGAGVGAAVPVAGDSLEETLKLVARNYNVNLVGEGQAAGRSAYVIQLSSKYLGRRGQRLWVDRSTHVILRSEKYRSDGSLATVSYFSGITFPKTLDPRLFVASVPPGLTVYEQTGTDSCVSPDRLDEITGFAPYVPALLPAGFRFAGAGITSSRAPEDTVHLRFTDGLDVISLFEARAEPGMRYTVRGASEIPLGRGTGFLFDACDTLVLSWSDRGIYFTLVGDLPVDVMRAIAESVTR